MIDFQGYGPRLLEGAWLTLQLALLSLALAVVLGLLTASARLSGRPLWRIPATVYTVIIRGVPDLVLMMLLFYGAQIGLNQVTDLIYTRWGYDIFINVDPFAAGVATIGLIFGAYMAETFRGAFLAVDRGQLEAAEAFGMGRGLIFRRIRFPLMMRHALPGLGNNWMVLLKTTALVSIIGLSDMVRVAAEATRATHQPFLFMLPVAVGYLVITAVSEIMLRRLEKRYSAGFEEVR